MTVDIKNEIFAKQVKDFMKQNSVYFIRNNERFRTKLKMNRRQLSYAIRHLEKIGFLVSWNEKVYQISNG
ncbi:hypothetical protein AYK21_01810 [Thermoplasmatales archaeon SG8-52-2]|nr:MAG: hypothetical protein AYK21_01810 [Thermoplasmatales archaeon SG8-52-2]